jgi:hypothetical protein
MAARFLEAAIGYGVLGWRVVPLLPGTKKPFWQDWPSKASSDAESIERWWQDRPTANVGVQMGQSSNLVDIETDSPSEEAAVAELFDGEPPVTLCFRSARGKHYLFHWHEDLPGGANVTYEGRTGRVTLRTGNGGLGAQSVFPPSVHESGAVYTWIVGPDDGRVMPLPAAVVLKLVNQVGSSAVDQLARREKRQRRLKGATEGDRNESAASIIGHGLRGLSDHALFDEGHIERQLILVQAWATTCSPPMDPKEVEATFKSIRRREQERRINSPQGVTTIDQPADDIDPADVPKGWRILVIDGEPPAYHLSSPLWDGVLVLDLDQVSSFPALRKAIVGQKGVVLGRKWLGELWDGGKDSPSLFKQLMACAEHIESSTEGDRIKIAAEMLWDLYERAADWVPNENRTEPSPRGAKLEDGSFVFRYSTVRDDMAYSPDKVTRAELSAVLDRISAKRRQRLPRKTGVTKNYVRLVEESINALKNLLHFEGDSDGS